MSLITVCVVWLAVNCFRLPCEQVTATPFHQRYHAGLEALGKRQAAAVGLPIRQIGLQYLPSPPPRYQPESRAVKVCSFLTFCRRLGEMLRKVYQVWGLAFNLLDGLTDKSFVSV